MAWSEKLPSGKYRGLYRDGAGKKRSAGTFSHKAMAVREAAAQEVKARKKMWSDPDAYKMKWSAWADQWWQVRDVEPSTLKRDESRRRVHLDPKWSTTPLGSIRRIDVKAWAAEMKAAGVGPSTIQRAVHLFSASLGAAVDAEILEFNPANRIKLSKGALAEARFLEPDEYESIREQLPTEFDQLVSDFLLDTGVRWSELAGLHRNRVDFKRKTIRIVETFSETGGTIKAYPKGKRLRDIPMSDRLAKALKARFDEIPAATDCGVPHRAGRCRSGLVFTTPSGTPLRNSNWAPIWREAVKASEVDHARPYDLRHTFASWLLQDGVSLDEVRQLLGHLSTQTTAIYAHLEKDPSQAARDSLAKRTRPAGRQKRGA